MTTNLTEGDGLSNEQLVLALRNWWMAPEDTGLSTELSQFGNEVVGGSVDTNEMQLSKSMYLTISMGF